MKSVSGICIYCGLTLASASLVNAQTTSGTIQSNESWSDTVRVTGDINIPEGVTLTIEPGTVILVAAHEDDQGTGYGGGPIDPITWQHEPVDDRSHISISVGGTLEATGTPDQPIWFTSTATIGDLQEPTKHDWDSISVSGTANLKYCIIEYVGGMNIPSSSVNISNCVLRHMLHNANFNEGSTAIFSGNSVYDCGFELNIRNASPFITHNIIRTDMASEFENRTTVEYNVFELMGAGSSIQDQSTFRYNLFTNCKVRGLLIRSSGVYKYNSFLNNAENVSIDAGQGMLDLSENWWSTTDSEEILSGIWSPIDRHFVVEPWLEAPHPDTPLPPPINLAGTPAFDSITLNWSMADYRSITGYRIHYDTDSEFPYNGQGAKSGPSPIEVGADTAYTISGLVPSQKYFLTVSAYDSTGRESWTSAEEVQLTTNQPNGAIKGIVKDSLTLHAIENATVTAGAGYSAVTEADGKYLIQGIPPGRYALQVEAEDYRASSSDAIAVLAGAESVADLRLELNVARNLFDSHSKIPELGIGLGPSVLCIAVDDGGRIFLGDFGGGMHVWDGSSWKSVGVVDGLAQDVVSSIAFGDAGKIWLAHKDFNYASHYDGSEWRVLRIEDGLASNNVWAVAVDHDDVVWFAHPGAGVTSYDGENWRVYDEESGLSSNGVFHIAVDHLNHKWFATMKGVSRFDGSQWKTFGIADGLPSEDVGCVYVDNSNDVWAGTVGHGVAKWSREENEWTSYTTADGLAGDFVSAIVQDNQGIMWFGTVYSGLSTFDGDSWTSYSVTDGLVFHVVDALAVDLEGRLWIGTWQGYSIYPRDALATSVSLAQPAVAPNRFDLTQNYPNPFNAETVIGYSISTPGTATIRIFDVLGREIEELVSDQHKRAGRYFTRWRNKDVASGLYFARLEQGDQVKTIRMIKVK
jgi:hypothetical protein